MRWGSDFHFVDGLDTAKTFGWDGTYFALIHTGALYTAEMAAALL